MILVQEFYFEDQGLRATYKVPWQQTGAAEPACSPLSGCLVEAGPSAHFPDRSMEPPCLPSRPALISNTKMLNGGRESSMRGMFSQERLLGKVNPELEL